jgi:ABC-type multidrug transport system ATPase subunit
LTTNLLSITDLTKSYGKKPLFDSYSRYFEHGAYALVGPNGSGKTTLLYLLSGLVKPNKGRITYCGFDLYKEPLKAKQLFSLVTDNCHVYPFLLGSEFLNIVSCARKVDKNTQISNLVDSFNLKDYLTAPFSVMSLGTQKKFLIVAGLIGDPYIMLMDEPTNAIDSKAKSVLVEVIKKRNYSGKLTIFATHDLNIINDTKAERITLK